MGQVTRSLRNFFRKLKIRGSGLLKKRRKNHDKKLLSPPAIPKPQARNRPQNQGWPALPSIAFTDAVNEFAGVQLSAHSRRAYAQDLKDFFSYCFTQGLSRSWNEEITPLLIAGYRQYLLDERQMAKSSITRKLATLKSFCRWAKSRGWLRDNPAELIRSFPQNQDSKTGFLNDQEILKLLDHFAEIPQEGLFRALSKCVIETLLMLGLRRSEASAIRLGDWEWNAGAWFLRVRGKGDRERLLPVPTRLLKTWGDWIRRMEPSTPTESPHENPALWVNFLKEHRERAFLISSRGRDFTRALSSAEIGRIVRKTCRHAGLIDRISPHMLRATAITHALDQGASHRGIQQMAGWTSPLMISRYDKRRQDPTFSAVHFLKYAQEKDEEAAP